MIMRALARREEEKVFLGVLGGFAEYFDTDPKFLRIIYAIATVVVGGFPGVLLYFIAAAFMPKR